MSEPHYGRLPQQMSESCPQIVTFVESEP